MDSKSVSANTFIARKLALEHEIDFLHNPERCRETLIPYLQKDYYIVNITFHEDGVRAEAIPLFHGDLNTDRELVVIDTDKFEYSVCGLFCDVYGELLDS